MPLGRQIPLIYSVLARLQQEPATQDPSAAARQLIPAPAASRGNVAPPLSSADEQRALSAPPGSAMPGRSSAGAPRSDAGPGRWASQAGSRDPGPGQRGVRDPAAAAAAAGFDIRSSADPAPIEL